MSTATNGLRVYASAALCRYNAADSGTGLRVSAKPRALAAADVWIDRHHRAPAGGRLCRLPRAPSRDLDGAAGAALSQSAARSHRGADLRPRMAARLRQAAAAAVVAGRDRLPNGGA